MYRCVYVALLYFIPTGTQTKEWKLPSWAHALACRGPTCSCPPISSPISECRCSACLQSLLTARVRNRDCAWWIWSFTRHLSIVLCPSSEISWQRRTRRVCLMLITSLCGTRERQSRSLARLSTPSPSAQVCRTKPVIRDSSSSMHCKRSSLSPHKTTLFYRY